MPSVKSFAYTDTYASIEWVRASKPASEASLRGWVRASTGSTMATDGVSA